MTLPQFWIWSALVVVNTACFTTLQSESLGMALAQSFLQETDVYSVLTISHPII